jgi:glucose/arabinose dehydrogenase
MQKSLQNFSTGSLAGLTLLISACGPTDVPAQTIKSSLHDFRVTVVAKGLDHPWGMAFLPNGGLLITERVGRLRLFRNGKLMPKPIIGSPRVVDSGQGGLLDIVLHPRFAENKLLYLSYAGRGAGGVNTQVARFRFDEAAHALTDRKLIFDALPKVRGGQHFGGRMTFDRAGYLYISVGDRGDKPRAQRLSEHAGSVIRLDENGNVPSDNPFVGPNNKKPEIFSYGHRNPQGMALHPQTGAVWIHEHGAQGGDEINIVQRGLNYGWPVITHGVDYGGGRIGIGKSAPGMEQPLYFWVPSIAPSGMAFYTGDRFPKWRNGLFLGALAGAALVRLELNGDRVVREERLLVDAVGRVRDVRNGPDGYLYIATDHDEGRILRLEPAP